MSQGKKNSSQLREKLPLSLLLLLPLQRARRRRRFTDTDTYGEEAWSLGFEDEEPSVACCIYWSPLTDYCLNCFQCVYFVQILFFQFMSRASGPERFSAISPPDYCILWQTNINWKSHASKLEISKIQTWSARHYNVLSSFFSWLDAWHPPPPPPRHRPPPFGLLRLI